MNREKINGILPDELRYIDVVICYQRDAKDAGQINQKTGAAWYIISQDSQLYSIYKGFDVLCCLLSSYYYAYMGAFVAPVWGERNFTIMLAFEFVFLCSMGFKFL